MRKTISNGINRRAVYKFQCTGPCNRMKFTYVYDRAKAGVCLSCSKNQVDENQVSLFETVSVVPLNLNGPDRKNVFISGQDQSLFTALQNSK